MSKTKIQWCQRPGTIAETWNPIQDVRKGESGRGYHCTKTSRGCAHCWAEVMNQRFGNARPFDNTPVEFEIVEKQYRRPEHWRKARTVFVESMGDLFHKEIDGAQIFDVLAQIEMHPQHLFMILTKRVRRAAMAFRARYEDSRMPQSIAKNLWTGVSVCTLGELWKMDTLRAIPSVCRFVSFEPLLEPTGIINLNGISQCIVGAETGPGARPMELDWARHIRDQCAQAGVKFFMKQTSDGDIPPDLMIREFPDGR